MNHLKEEWEYIKSIQYIPLKNLKRNLVKSRLNKLKFEYIKDVLICILSLKSNNIKSFFNFINYYEEKKVNSWEQLRDDFLSHNWEFL
jgi:hypothetical protein